MSVTVKTTGKIELDLAGMLDFASSKAVGIVQRRTARGLTIDGEPMEPYSAGYEKTLALMGESPDVDLTVTGAYIADIGERSRAIGADSASAVIGPGSGTSAEKRPAPGASQHFYADVANDLLAGDLGEHLGQKRSKRHKSKRTASSTGRRSPPHNVLGAYLHYGTEHMPARPHLGLSDAERASIARDLVRFKR